MLPKKMTIDEFLHETFGARRWTYRARVLTYLIAAGEAGCTADEVWLGLEEYRRNTSSVDTAIVSLLKNEILEPTNRKRPTRKGSLARVYVLRASVLALIETPKPSKRSLVPCPTVAPQARVPRR